jgi:hypothetical protein
MGDSATSTEHSVTGNRIAALLPLAALLLLTLAEVRIFDRLLFERRTDYDFVLTSVDGVLSGSPVSKSWQQRIIGPAAVAALTAITATRLDALRLFSALMTAAANALLFVIVRRKGGSPALGLLATLGFGIGHWLLLYRLEYPWDGIDVLLFLSFGFWAQKRDRLSSLWPLLLIGAVNHETVLYIPLWYLLSCFGRAGRTPGIHTELGRPLLVFGLLSIVIAGLRQWLYVGQPDLPGQFFELATPVIGNHLHVEHNIRTFLGANWRAGATFFTAAILSAFTLLVALATKRGLVLGAVWSACVIGSVFCFGYLNETRHYLSLLAFWFGYGVTTPTRAPAVETEATPSASW